MMLSVYHSLQSRSSMCVLCTIYRLTSEANVYMFALLNAYTCSPQDCVNCFFIFSQLLFRLCLWHSNTYIPTYLPKQLFLIQLNTTQFHCNDIPRVLYLLSSDMNHSTRFSGTYNHMNMITA